MVFYSKKVISGRYWKMFHAESYDSSEQV